MPPLLHCKEYGEGKPVVILHGLFGSLENWHHIATRLSAQFRVFSLDLRNHGRSPHEQPMSYPLMADDVVAFMKARGVQNAALLGHSMGGKTAMELALTHPADLKSLVVVDIAPRQYPPWHGEILSALQSLDLSLYKTRWEMDAVLAPAIPEAAVRQFLLKNVVRNTDGQFFWRLNLSAIASAYGTLTASIPSTRSCVLPALFVAGERSDYLGPQDESQIRALFPNAQFATVANAGHWLHAEQPGAFLELLTGFLREHFERS